MPQQEQEDKEQEITLTAILEEINKSTSSKSDNSIREEQSHEHVLNEARNSGVELEGNWVFNEQSTGDKSQGSLLGEIRPDLPPGTSTNRQDEVTTANVSLQNTNSCGLLIPREEFTHPWWSNFRVSYSTMETSLR